MDSPDPVTIGAVAAAGFALAQGLTSVITKLVDRLFKKEAPGAADLTPMRIEKKVDQVIDWQSAKDANGLPLGYFPRSMLEDQRKIAELLHGTAEQLERVAERLDGLSRDLDRGFTEVRRDIARLGK